MKVIHIQTPFDLRLTILSGQFFSYIEMTGGYEIVTRKRVIFIKQTSAEKITYFVNEDVPEDKEMILEFLGLNLPWTKIISELKKDPVLNRILPDYQNIRILYQDPWECALSFMLSQASSIKKIRKTLSNLSHFFEYNHKRHYQIPSPEEISRLTESQIRFTGAGFRAPYLLAMAKQVERNPLFLKNLQGKPHNEIIDILLRIKGIGRKIANCIALFSLKDLSAFPVDVWVKRAVRKLYFCDTEKSVEYIENWGRDHFGKYAGVAQQILFCWARDGMKL
jgi:N-glycosylase/DNA lyase